jgi:hypothetical protein
MLRCANQLIVTKNDLSPREYGLGLAEYFSSLEWAKICIHMKCFGGHGPLDIGIEKNEVCIRSR